MVIVLRMLVGPFDYPVRVRTPLNPEGCFGLALTTLLATKACGTGDAEPPRADIRLVERLCDCSVDRPYFSCVLANPAFLFLIGRFHSGETIERILPNSRAPFVHNGWWRRVLSTSGLHLAGTHVRVGWCEANAVAHYRPGVASC